MQMKYKFSQQISCGQAEEKMILALACLGRPISEGLCACRVPPLTAAGPGAAWQHSSPPAVPRCVAARTQRVARG